MKKHALSWLADRLMPKPATPAEPIGYKAVAEALETSKLRADLVAMGAPVNPVPPATMTIDPKDYDWTEVQPSTEGERVKNVVTAAQPGTPEYHLGLMNGMITTLTARIERAETKRADQRKAYDDDKHQRALEQERSDQAQAAEIAGLVKSLAAYRAAHDVLAPPTPNAEPAIVERKARRPRSSEQRESAEGKETRPTHVNPSDRDGDKMS